MVEVISRTKEILSKLESACLSEKPGYWEAIEKMNEEMEKVDREYKYKAAKSEYSAGQCYLTA